MVWNEANSCRDHLLWIEVGKDRETKPNLFYMHCWCFIFVLHCVSQSTVQPHRRGIRLADKYSQVFRLMDIHSAAYWVPCYLFYISVVWGILLLRQKRAHVSHIYHGAVRLVSLYQSTMERLVQHKVCTSDFPNVAFSYAWLLWHISLQRQKGLLHQGWWGWWR